MRAFKVIEVKAQYQLDVARGESIKHIWYEPIEEELVVHEEL